MTAGKPVLRFIPTRGQSITLVLDGVSGGLPFPAPLVQAAVRDRESTVMKKSFAASLSSTLHWSAAKATLDQAQAKLGQTNEDKIAA